MTRAGILASVARWPADLREEWEERAAIIEDGCRVSREESERRAFDVVGAKVPMRQAELLKVGSER